MPPLTLVLLIVATTSVIQSLFGVGVLLFGTPWLLLIGLDFISALQYLLPVSLGISLLQAARDGRFVDRTVLRRLVLLTAPAIAITLAAASFYRPRLELLVALLIAMVALQERARWIGRGIRGLLERERTYMVVMGAVHGASNLGGGLLTAWVYGTGLHGRAARGTVAVAYGMFASVQLGTLALGPVSWQPRAAENVLLALTGAAVFIVTERWVFSSVRAGHYRKGLEVLLLATSMLLVVRVLP